MSGDLDQRELGMVIQCRPHGVEDLVRRREDLRRVVSELDLVEDDDVVVLDDDASLVGAAALVLEAVLVLGLVRTLVHLVGDTIVVVVRIGAPVLVLEAVTVLRLVGTLVFQVGNAVTVAVAVVTLGASILIVDTIAVLGNVGTVVVHIGDSVVVVVRIGAPVLVLEAVEVLRVVGTLVDVVLDPIAITVANGRLERKAQEHALVGGLEARRVTRAGTQNEVRIALDEDLDAAHCFVAHLRAAIGAARQKVRAVSLGHEVEGLEHPPRDAAAVGEEVPIGEVSVLQREDGRRRRRVPAIAAVEGDTKLALRPKTLLEDQRGPVPEAIVGSGV